jgi:hypothetical protein
MQKKLEIKNSVIRISNGENKKILGTGFLVEGGFLLTAYHVVENIHQFVFEIFTQTEEYGFFNHEIYVNPGFYCDEALDIAIFTLNNPQQYQERFLKLVSEMMSEKANPLEMFGFPNAKNQGIPDFSLTVESLNTPDDNGYRKITISNAQRIEKGFSGGPLFDPNIQAVIGLFTDLIPGGGWGIPSSKLIYILNKYFNFEVEHSKKKKEFYRSKNPNDPKVFVFHQYNSQASLDHFQRLVKMASDPRHNSIGINFKSVEDLWGNHEIGEFDQDTIQKVWQDADGICVLLEGETFDSYWDESCSNLFRALQLEFPKKLFWINIDQSLEAFKAYFSNPDWGNDYETFPHKSMIDLNIESFNKFAEKTNAHRDSVRVALLKLLSDTLIGNNSTRLERRFISHFNFFQQESILLNRNHPQGYYNFFLLEGTNQCGHYLFIHRILKKVQRKNKEMIYKIDFSVRSETETLWDLIYKGLGFTSQETNVPKGVFQQLNRKLEYENVFIVLEGLSTEESDFGFVLNNFWKEMNSFASKNYEPQNRFYIFGLNRKLEQSSLFETLKLESSELCMFIPFPPIEALARLYYKQEIYNYWYPEDDLTPVQKRRLNEERQEFINQNYVEPAALVLMQALNIPKPSNYFSL